MISHVPSVGLILGLGKQQIKYAHSECCDGDLMQEASTSRQNMRTAVPNATVNLGQRMEWKTSYFPSKCLSAAVH